VEAEKPIPNLENFTSAAASSQLFPSEKQGAPKSEKKAGGELRSASLKESRERNTARQKVLKGARKEVIKKTEERDAHQSKDRGVQKGPNNKKSLTMVKIGEKTKKVKGSRKKPAKGFRKKKKGRHDSRRDTP